jgi:hypothetical protein
MNANGMARGYLAKNMNNGEFIHFVLDCILKQLKEWNHDVRLESYELEECYKVILTIEGAPQMILLSKVLCRLKQSEGPYALDRYLWEKIKSNGHVLHETHYIKTVHI